MFHNHYLRNSVVLKPPVLFGRLHSIGTRCSQLFHIAERVLLKVSFIPKLHHGGTHCHRTCMFDDIGTFPSNLFQYLT